MQTTRASFVPSVISFNRTKTSFELKEKKVLVVGSGCAGLAAAWQLNRSGFNVQIFEADSRLGGHANTVAVDGVEVDTGFMVYNELNYPNLCAFFEEIGVEGTDTEMGFSVSLNNGGFEWCSDSIPGLLATPSNATNPQFYAMLKDIFRFNSLAMKRLCSASHGQDSAGMDVADAKGKSSKANSESVRDFLQQNGFTDAFRDFYLVPMTAAIWSASADGILDFPVITLFTFLNNHLLLQVAGHINWRTPSKRSKEYVDKVQAELGDRVHLKRGVSSIERIRNQAIYSAPSSSTSSSTSSSASSPPSPSPSPSPFPSSTDIIGAAMSAAADVSAELAGLGSVATGESLSSSGPEGSAGPAAATWVQGVDVLIPQPRSSSIRERPTEGIAEDTVVTGILVRDEAGGEEIFDEVIFACHPDQALRILGKDATDKERELLGCFQYSKNETVVHSDPRLMPHSKAAWTCWNCIDTSPASSSSSSSLSAGEEQPSKSDQSSRFSKPIFVTYWLNKLQKLQHPRDIFVSLNPQIAPDESKVHARISYAHPQYTTQSVHAQRAVAEMQGENGVYFCGAWMGYGFHEDGFRSGLEVALAVSGSIAPPAWVNKWGLSKMIPAPKYALAKSVKEFTLVALIMFLLTPFFRLLERLCQTQVCTFLAKGFRKGKLTITLPCDSPKKGSVAEKTLVFAGNKESVVGKKEDEVVLCVRDAWFFVRLAVEADLGLARSYIAGEWEIEDTGPYSDGLTRFLGMLIDNMPNGREKASGAGAEGALLDAGKLLTAVAGETLNMLWFKFTMDNSIANARSNIHAHYDLSNALFETFLDKEYMMYSSAIFETQVLPPSFSKSSTTQQRTKKSTTATATAPPTLAFTDSLESAQIRKIDTLLSRLEPIGAETTLLDIGFGWGGICIRAAEKYGCRVTGITLSTEQKALAEQKVAEKGLSHLINFQLIDYRAFAAQRAKLGGRAGQFDRIVSCEMIEAVGHAHLGSFFDAVESLLALDGVFVMQAITMPDARYSTYVTSADFINTIIFPGGCCPSLSALLSAMAAKSTLHLESATNHSLHYAETLRRWRVRFNDAMPRVLALGFDDTFIRLWNLYFCYCEAGFQKQVINLQILTFSRTGNSDMILSQAVPPRSTLQRVL